MKLFFEKSWTETLTSWIETSIFILSNNKDMTRQEVQSAAANILSKMGGDADVINNGDCATFAKALVDLVGGIVVDGLSDTMKSELDSYETQAPQVRVGRFQSHCWVFVAGYYFDAYNTEGCEYEEDMDWREKI